MTKQAFLALNERQDEAGDSRRSPIRAIRRRARCARRIPRSPPRARCGFFAYAWGEMQRDAGATRNPA